MRFLSAVCNLMGLRRVREVHKRHLASTERIEGAADAISLRASQGEEMDETIRDLVEDL